MAEPLGMFTNKALVILLEKKYRLLESIKISDMVLKKYTIKLSLEKRSWELSVYEMLCEEGESCRKLMWGETLKRVY